MSEITALVGLSPSHVQDLFKAELGISPMQYHKGLRLEKARALLENSAMKIKQIWLEIGYQAPVTFFEISGSASARRHRNTEHLGSRRTGSK
jgi:transcriptional regulator GlxA family with amidase domain